ncbi:adhesion G protein-coupled receptor L3-like [Mercenaria mercenaria]|uniref:adhesion G protein-coupled receptor L3-like n=1 Tax=Mercenaria mercenaria TaxID=6596 RepID=UPI00234FA018|nr:adhesion G protein-coupled receptor L3-like [Mercenaria mercenaria]
MELLPWLQIELPYRTHVEYIEIIGRTDYFKRWAHGHYGLALVILQYLNVITDDEDSLQQYNVSTNTVTVYPLTPTIKKVNITRPYNQEVEKLKRYNFQNTEEKWQLYICEVNFYVQEEDALECPAGKDYMDLPWDRGAKGLFTRRSCPDGYTGEAKRYCDEEGTYLDPVYNCTSSIVADIYEKVLDDSVKVEPITVLETLANVTSSENEKNGSILLGDMNAIIKIMNVIADTSEQKKSDAEIRAVTDFFMETTSNIIGESTTTTWRTMIYETGIGADAMLNNVDRFLENALTERDTVEVVKPNLYIKREPITVCENGTNFPSRRNEKSPDWIEQTRSNIFLGCDNERNTSSFSGVIYRNVSQILPSTTGPERDLQQQLNSPVMSFTYYPKVVGKMRHPVEITLQTFNNALENPVCTFWEKGKGAQGYWSRKGCWLHKYNRQDNIVVCKCDHLTNFAVLMSLSPYTATEHQLALNIITKTGLITSLVFLLLANGVYCVFWRYVKSVQSIIKLNLSCMLFLANLLFLTGVDRTGNKIVCTAIAGLLHLLYLSVFAIMFALGLDMAYIMVKPTHTQSPGLRLLFVFYGSAILIVAVTMGAVQLEGYGNEKFCWLSVETGLIWTFLIPVLVIILINLIIVAVVIKIMCGTAYMSRKTSIEKVKSGVRGIIVLMPLMGLTWLFGIFSTNEETVVFQYLFAVFNSLQGLFIFIFHCVMNKKIRVACEKMRIRWLSSESRSTTIELRS